MRLMVSGGGTGGHIYPALALIDEVRANEPNSEFMFVGTDRGLESRIVPEQKIPFETIRIQGFKRSLSLDNLKTINLFIQSVFRARKLIKAFKPDVVVGTGGYVSGAVVFAASMMKIPTVIHEQNSVVGVTNKFLSRFVSKIAISFQDAAKDFPAKKTVLTGNPRATQVLNVEPIQDLTTIGLSNSLPTVLVFGGSRGAEKINSTMVDAIAKLSKMDFQTLFITGQVHYEKIINQINPADIGDKVIVKPYFANMPQLLPRIDLIIGRAGATSLAEITSLGIPSILVPSPYVTNDHQTKNALSLVNANAAEIIKEDQLDADKLLSSINTLMTDKDARLTMAQNAKKIGEPEAAKKLYELVKSTMKK